MKLLLSLTDQSFNATKSVGIFNVSLGLAKGLMKHPGVTELHLLGNEECAASFSDLPNHVRLHLADRPVPRRFGRIWWDQVALSASIRRISPDWVLLPKGFPPFFPLIGKAKLACYVHDVNWEYYTKKRRGKGSPFPWHELQYFRALGLRALKVSDLVLTSTRFNAERFRSYAPQAHTAVVGIGFDGPACVSHPRNGRGVLFYASPYPHKLTMLGAKRLNAWLQHRNDADSISIHVIGHPPKGADLNHPAWILHGRMPQKELQTLMRDSCRVSVYFSDYEGYGMPPVESLRAGIPCVASALPPIRENIPARYIFDNESEADFIRVMDSAYDSQGSPECPDFPTWEKVAQRCVNAMINNNSACQNLPIHA